MTVAVMVVAMVAPVVAVVAMVVCGWSLSGVAVRVMADAMRTTDSGPTDDPIDHKARRGEARHAPRREPITF